MLRRLFIDHPAEVRESYFEHMGQAGGFGLRMIAGGIACLVHGLVPGLCVKTGSRVIGDLHDRMVVNRTRH
jgi:hypothetical protein